MIMKPCYFAMENILQIGVLRTPDSEKVIWITHIPKYINIVTLAHIIHGDMRRTSYNHVFDTLPANDFSSYFLYITVTVI